VLFCNQNRERVEKAIQLCWVAFLMPSINTNNPRDALTSGGTTGRLNSDMASVNQNRVLKNASKFQNIRDVVCVWDGCGLDAHPHLTAPLCMDHAKKLTVQVMLLTAKDPKPSTKQQAKKHAAEVHRLHAPKERVGLVYFIKFSDRVKIGFTTDLATRMRQLPHDEILAVIPGTVSDEQALHKKFDALRITGEWFDNDPRLTDFIKTLPVHESLAA
jgi:hypothetical protein